MTVQTICILMPGDMGHGVGKILRDHGYETITALDGRSARTKALAELGELRNVGSFDAAVGEADMILSILPPVEATNQATAVADAMKRVGKSPVYVDCNAISTGTAIDVGNIVTAAGAPFIDAGIIGLTPSKSKNTQFYVSGADTAPMMELSGKGFKVIDLGTEPGRASTFKMVYAAFTKGSWTLWTALLLAAERNNLLPELLEQFEHSQSDMLKKMRGKVPLLPADSARWVGEMQEIAKTFREAGVHGGFHDGAAWVFELLSETPFAEETRENMDTNRTLEDSLKVYAEALAKRDA